MQVCTQSTHMCPSVITNLLHDRLGELVPPSDNRYDPDLHVSNDVSVDFGATESGVEYISFDIPKTKTETHGARLRFTHVDDPSSFIPSFKNLQTVNVDVPRGAPLFAYSKADGNWEALTKERMLKRCNEVWKANGLLELPGHAFRIGGCTEMLLRGVPPDVVMVLGRWKSQAFLEYWRRIDAILPLFLTNSFNTARVNLTRNTMSSFTRRQASSTAH